MAKYRYFRDSKWIIAMAALAALNTGCTVASGVRVIPQSHFDYPNSNVTPLGRVQAEATKSSFFFPEVLSADLEEEVIQKALSQKGGDVLTDYVLKIEVSGGFIIPIFTTTYKVDGMAAKMEVGKQVIDKSPVSENQSTSRKQSR